MEFGNKTDEYVVCSLLNIEAQCMIEIQRFKATIYSKCMRKQINLLDQFDPNKCIGPCLQKMSTQLSNLKVEKVDMSEGTILMVKIQEAQLNISRYEEKVSIATTFNMKIQQTSVKTVTKTDVFASQKQEINVKQTVKHEAFPVFAPVAQEGNFESVVKKSFAAVASTKSGNIQQEVERLSTFNQAQVNKTDRVSESFLGEDDNIPLTKSGSSAYPYIQTAGAVSAFTSIPQPAGFKPDCLLKKYKDVPEVQKKQVVELVFI